MADLLSVKSKSIETNISFGSSTDFTSRTQLYNEKDLEKNPIGSTPEKSNNEKSKGSNEKKEYTGIKKYGGMLLTLTASLFFSLAILIVKVLKDYGFQAYGASFWRYLGVTVPCIPLIMFYEWGPPRKAESPSVFASVWPMHKNGNWKTIVGLLSRGLIGSTSVILRYFALQYLTIGDTSVITYSTPVLVTILAHFFLGEKCGVIPILVAFTTLGGVIIITRPPIITGAESFDTDTLIGTALACGSLVCSALIVIITRKIREVQFALMTFVFGIIGVLQAFILTQIFDNFSVPGQLIDSLLVLGLGGLSFLGQMAIILALKFEQAGPVALIRTCDVLFGFLLQFIFLGVIPDEYSSIGAIIVLSGVLITGLRKWLSLLPADDKRRQRFCILLR